MGKVKAVLFDWDLTLGAPLGKVSAGKRFSVLLKSVGFHYSSNAVTGAIRRRLRDIEEGRLCGKVSPQTRHECVVFYQQILAILGHADVSPELANRLYDSYARLRFTLYEDALSALQVSFNPIREPPHCDVYIIRLFFSYVPSQRGFRGIQGRNHHQTDAELARPPKLGPF